MRYNLKVFVPVVFAMFIIILLGAFAVNAGWFGIPALAVIIILAGVAGGEIYLSFQKK